MDPVHLPVGADVQARAEGEVGEGGAPQGVRPGEEVGDQRAARMGERVEESDGVRVGAGRVQHRLHGTRPARRSGRLLAVSMGGPGHRKAAGSGRPVG
ncbi:hypothetical protein OG782_00385 [Streptomyces sp. NBC_00876]|uniref:hypothetical protein n=1 Tax=Streptomyces sp. NBC_00876 TaxID=2975853 RepID=UPI0038685338|nr:hypothetical protein OG782_00385 [Streptomyces sp. NBC_00876]